MPAKKMKSIQMQFLGQKEACHILDTLSSEKREYLESCLKAKNSDSIKTIQGTP
jgi:hypothetical protein